MIGRSLGKLLARIRDTVRNEPRELEFQAELEEHVRLLAERYRRQGTTAEAAMLAARRQFLSLWINATRLRSSDGTSCRGQLADRRKRGRYALKG
jgi:hypothetical protein